MSDDSPVFGGFKEEPQKPHSDSEWINLDIAITEAFSPHSPIDAEELFAGRIDILNDIIDAVFQKGCHAIIYGERGVGKTSFANILRDKVFSKSKLIKIIK